MTPGVVPPLDPRHRPAARWDREFARAVHDSGESEALALMLSRPDGSASVHEVPVFATGHPRHSDNVRFAERRLKSLLWQRGASAVRVAGPAGIAEHLERLYSPAGARAFDAEFMGRVYGEPFRVDAARPGETFEPVDRTSALGRHLDGHRIGFDLGASDYKVSAISHGEVVWADEFPWQPRDARDVDYHYRHISAGLRAAASHLPRVDAIGGSSAGVWIDDSVRVASLFRGLEPSVFDRDARSLFTRIQAEWGVPLRIVNDGEVTALAGSMSLGVDAVLGIAMGTSQAAGYVARGGGITPWLNELAFVPIDLQPDAPVDDWSGDTGCGAQYFSQTGVVRLAERAGVVFEPDAPTPERLVRVQELMAAGDRRIPPVYETLGTWLGYALAHYAECYDVDHVLVLGRAMSGPGGTLVIDLAAQVLEVEFGDLDIRIHTPDERMKRVGQSVAAASLPAAAQDVPA